MTPEQFKAEMERIVQEYGGDTEAVHSEMDKLLCQILTRLGYAEGVVVFCEQERWYA